MLEHFEWSWLGYLWGFSVVFPLVYASLLAVSEGYGAMHGKTPTGSLYGHQIMALLGMGGACFTGLLTMYFWGWQTALVLSAGALSWALLLMFVCERAVRNLTQAR